jgi:Uma2 family endonuclease
MQAEAGQWQIEGGEGSYVVEIVSPGPATYDRSTKLQPYARAGISEYWLADPATRTIEILRLVQGTYRPLGIFQGQTLLPSPVTPKVGRCLPGLPTPVERFLGEKGQRPQI